MYQCVCKKQVSDPSTKNSLLTESKSSGTINNYHHGFLRWKKWAQTYGIKKDGILPAKDLHVALYLASVVSFVKAWKTYVKENIYKYAYHEKRNLQYAIYTIYKYAHDENMKYNIGK
jgi:hypothetical protein